MADWPSFPFCLLFSLLTKHCCGCEVHRSHPRNCERTAVLSWRLILLHCLFIFTISRVWTEFEEKESIFIASADICVNKLNDGNRARHFFLRRPVATWPKQCSRVRLNFLLKRWNVHFYAMQENKTLESSNMKKNKWNRVSAAEKHESLLSWAKRAKYLISFHQVTAWSLCRRWLCFAFWPEIKNFQVLAITYCQNNNGFVISEPCI